ncbi:Serine/threonine-protein kinase TEL1 [Mesorhizobium loti]|nr:Serine/threonine-protein kinase TEL1 [Mesorhizobium loti]
MPLVSLWPDSVRSKVLSVVTGGVLAVPLSVRLLNDRVPATGAVLSTTTEMAAVFELLPALSVTTARNW